MVVGDVDVAVLVIILAVEETVLTVMELLEVVPDVAGDPVGAAVLVSIEVVGDTVDGSLLVCATTREDEESVLVLDVVPAVVGNAVVLVSTMVSGEALLVWEVVGASVSETVIVGDAAEGVVLISPEVVRVDLGISLLVGITTIEDRESLLVLEVVPAVAVDASVFKEVVGDTVDVLLLVCVDE